MGLKIPGAVGDRASALYGLAQLKKFLNQKTCSVYRQVFYIT